LPSGNIKQLTQLSRHAVMGGLATVLMNETCGDKVLCNKAITEASQLYEKYSKNYSHDRITLVNNICATLG